MEILLFLIAHWYLAGFSQSFFLHRYGAHKMFKMNLIWERIFYFLTFFSQGASYLNPRAYALLHRLHHAYSDTDKDPHSPKYCGTPAGMMLKTFKIYMELFLHKRNVEPRFEGGYPAWKWFDSWADAPFVRLLWIIFYVLFYIRFATVWWQYLLLPIHIFMGPIHGAIVNWCGHKYGYTNFDNRDCSRNTFPLDFLTVGELMQNNHHHFSSRPNFAVRKFEFDPTYSFI